MKRIAATVLAIALTAATGSALAQNYPYPNDDQYGYGDDARYGNGDRYDDRYGNDDRYGDSRYGRGYDMAQVVGVDPIFARNERCGDGRYDGRYDRRYDRRYDGRYNGYNNGYTSGRANGAALGAIIGGALGNQAGKGDGRKAATVAGAVIGGVVGAQVGANNDGRYGGNGAYACSGSYRNGGYGQGYGNDRYGRGYEEQRVVGYNVTYRYAGRNYHTVTDHHPGRTIRVRVDVRPDGRRIAMGM